MAVKIMSAVFSHHKQLVFPVGTELFFGGFYHLQVIGPRQTLVGGYNKIGVCAGQFVFPCGGIENFSRNRGNARLTFCGYIGRILSIQFRFGNYRCITRKE